MQTKAKRQAKILPEYQPVNIQLAINMLRSARNALRLCGCKNAANYTARALKSAEGALRHTQRFAIGLHD
jgi:hypothetical protein